MILPDGNIVKFGSGADPFSPKEFWPHGPGPDLYLLPVYGLGTMGILVEVTLKCWLLGEKTKELWVAYEDIDKACVYGAGHPMGPFLYTVSLMHCMPVGRVDGGTGLGMMWGREKAVEMLSAAGFSEVQVAPVAEDPFNDHFLCRKPG